LHGGLLKSPAKLVTLTRIGIAVQSISSGMLLFRHMRCGEGGTGQRTNIFLLWKCAPLPIEDI
jgi:hypothetical protein